MVVVDTCLEGTWPVEALNLVAVEVQPNIPRLMVIRSEPEDTGKSEVEAEHPDSTEEVAVEPEQYEEHVQ